MAGTFHQQDASKGLQKDEYDACVAIIVSKVHDWQICCTAPSQVCALRRHPAKVANMILAPQLQGNLHVTAQ